MLASILWDVGAHSSEHTPKSNQSNQHNVVSSQPWNLGQGVWLLWASISPSFLQKMMAYPLRWWWGLTEIASVKWVLSQNKCSMMVASRHVLEERIMQREKGGLRDKLGSSLKNRCRYLTQSLPWRRLFGSGKGLADWGLERMQGRWEALFCHRPAKFGFSHCLNNPWNTSFYFLETVL